MMRFRFARALDPSRWPPLVVKLFDVVTVLAGIFLNGLFVWYLGAAVIAAARGDGLRVLGAVELVVLYWFLGRDFRLSVRQWRALRREAHRERWAAQAREQLDDREI